MADWQSAILGLTPKCSPLHWIFKSALAVDDAFSSDGVVRLDAGRSWGKAGERCESACSGLARLDITKRKETSRVQEYFVFCNILGSPV